MAGISFRSVRNRLLNYSPEVLAGAATIIGLAIPGWQAYVDRAHPVAGHAQAILSSLGVLAAFCAIWGFVQRTNTQNQEQESRKSLTLLGAAQVLCRLIRQTKALPISANDGKIRITIHRVTLDKTASGGTIQQMVQYVGGRGGEAGRIFPIAKGIIGYAVRTEKPHTTSRQVNDFKDYVEELVGKWGYTEREAKEKQSDRMSWMAVPILAIRNPQAGDEVIGVIYLDADVPDFFDLPTKEFVLAGCEGIKEHVNEVFL